MFNLLPQDDQRILLNEYRFRFAVICMFFLVALGSVASIALIPSVFLSYQIEDEKLQSVAILEKEISAITSDDLSKTLSLSNKKIAALSSGITTSYSYELVDDVIGDKVRGIKILGIDIWHADTNTKDVTISGEANNRDALLSFIKILENEDSFTNVTVPVSDFAPVTNINFSVLLKTK